MYLILSETIVPPFRFVAVKKRTPSETNSEAFGYFEE